MSDLDTGLADSANTSAEPIESAAPQTVDSIFDAVESELSATETPDPTVEATDPAASAIVTPAPTPESLESAAGPIPFERHKAALENARTKARDEVVQQVQQQYGGAVQLAQAMQRDPVGTITQLVSELQQHPTYGPALKSHAAKVLGQRKPIEDPEPEPDLQTADGQLVYSAGQHAKREAWFAKQIRAQLQQEFAPALNVAKREEAREQQTQYVAQAVEGYRPYVEEMQSMPGFTDHRAEIVARQQQLFTEAVQAGRSVDPMMLVLRAYREIVPAKQQAAQQSQIAQSQQSLMQQAAAKMRASSANPGASAATQPRALRVAGRSQSAVIDDIFDAAIAEAGT